MIKQENVAYSQKKINRCQLWDDPDIEIYRTLKQYCNYAQWGKGNYSCNQWKDKKSHQRYRKYKKNQMKILELENTVSEINSLDSLNGRR